MTDQPSSQVGARLGNRIAMLVVQAVAYAHLKLHDVKHRLAMAIFHSISDMISDEVDVTLGPFIKMLHDNTPEDHPAYAAVHFMHTATGQLKAIAGAGLQMSGLLGSVAAIMNNELAAQVYNVIRSNPGLLPDAGTIVNSFAAGLTAANEAQGALGALGIQYGWSDKMLQMSYNYPGLAEALELYRRQWIGEDTFRQWLILNAVPGDAITALLNLATVPLSPADAALAVLRGNITQRDGEKIAADNGLGTGAFSILIGNTGEPPGLEQLLEAYRRGFIDQATLEKGILQSRYRNEWIPVLEQLRYAPMPTADAVNAVVQGHLSMEQGDAISRQNGLEPGSFDTLYQTAGEPLSRTEMEQLYNRGLVTKDQVIQALSESRLKNKYNDLAFELHKRLLTPDVLSRGVAYGAVTPNDAIAKIMELGYASDDAALLADAAMNERLKVYKDRVVQSVISFYETGVMSASDAANAIQSAGHSDAEVQVMLTAADYHREAAIVNSAIRAIRSKYLAHHVPETVASGQLDALGVPATQRDYLLQAWNIEIQSSTKLLTEAQIMKALNNQLITQDDATSRLTALGYSADDAALLIAGA